MSPAARDVNERGVSAGDTPAIPAIYSQVRAFRPSYGTVGIHWGW